jgi:hypothetical protein
MHFNFSRNCGFTVNKKQMEYSGMRRGPSEFSYLSKRIKKYENASLYAITAVFRFSQKTEIHCPNLKKLRFRALPFGEVQSKAHDDRI